MLSRTKVKEKYLFSIVTILLLGFSLAISNISITMAKETLPEDNSTTLNSPPLQLVVLYDNGSYFENVHWETIEWANVDKVGIKRADLGRVGFESQYGCCLWYPLGFNKPLMFIAQRLWGKVGAETHNFYVQGNVAKTPFLHQQNDSWTLGWKGTITYNNYDFPVSIGVKCPTTGDRFYYKTNVTTPVSVDNAGIEYLLYANPVYAGYIAYHANNIRLYFTNGTTKDYTINRTNLNLTYAIPNCVANIGIVTDAGEEINKFDFSDVFNVSINQWLRIEQITLPNGQNTYVLRVGCAFGPLLAGETLIIDPSTVGTRSRLIGDLNGDCKVGAADIILLGHSILKRPGEEGYHVGADLNGDSKVGAADIIILGQHILEKCMP